MNMSPQLDIQNALRQVASNYSSVEDFKAYLIATGIPTLNWCVTGMAFLPPLPQLFVNGVMDQYTSVPSTNFSLFFWTLAG